MSSPSDPDGSSAESSSDRSPAHPPPARIAEPTQEELDGLPVDRRLELLELQRQRDDQERERRRHNRHQWFNNVGILFGVLFAASGLIATVMTVRAGQEELGNSREGCGPRKKARSPTGTPRR
ncbi:hypothetical protein [Actinomadura kijaniata]|uniref:hypothetical protein n=1 Tax=Actinomadura kijaniata TaxID=46161 RepID=UPI000B33BC55|nr:hypothetical protein [Actinomadura kijaniata]